MVGNNNLYTTENTRKQGKTTVGEEMMGAGSLLLWVFLVFQCSLFYRDYCLLPWYPVCMVIDLINLLFTYDGSILQETL